MDRRGLSRWGVLLAAVLLLPAQSRAYDEPSVNLGFTTFLDGGPPAGPGWYFQEYVQYRSVEQFNGNDGRELRAPDGTPLSPNLDVWISLNQIVYQSNRVVLAGGKWGFEAILPVVYFDLQTPNRMGLREASPALGDLYGGVFLQWDPIMGERGPVFMHRIELAAIAPTGKYDKRAALNGGAHFFSLNPYWAGTWWLLPRLTMSWRIHYLWNDENSHTGKQAGQAVHSNLTLAYEVLPNRLRLGANAYQFHQIENTELNGRPLPGSKERVIAVGPGLVYHFSPHDHLFANVFFETDVENRPQSTVFQLRWTHHFH